MKLIGLNIILVHKRVGLVILVVLYITKGSIHIFVDKSSIELFTNDWKDVFTLLTYPNESQTGIELFAHKKGTNMELNAWMLKSIWK